ncbi:MAG: Cna B-type domain-containing protein, partial [Clostridia bacterium]|nr:Cna B-type domain-containing protein [Clostridia bacterium]
RYILTAHFKPKDTVRVDYEAGEFGSITNALDFYGENGGYTGSKAVPDERYIFVGWYDKEDLDGDPVYTEPEITPEVLRDTLKPQKNKTYVAKFKANPTMPFKISVEPKANYGTVTYTSGGRNISFLGGQISGKDSDIHHTITARPAEGAVFDHWEWRGEDGTVLELTESDAKILDPTSSILPNSTKVPQWDAQLVAVFKPDEEKQIIINYVIDDRIDAEVINKYLSVSNGREIAISAEDILEGSTASAADGSNWTFAGWIVANADGTVRSVAGSGEAELVPYGNVISDNIVVQADGTRTVTYAALFRPTNKGIISYNANLKGVNVTWDGQTDLIWTTNEGGVAFADNNGGNYYTQKKADGTYWTFTIPEIEPKAEGYKFIGWFDKSREGQIKGAIANLENIEKQKEPALRQKNETLYFLYEDDRYTLEALWVKIDAQDKVVAFNQAQHSITGEVNIEAGTLLKEDGQYRQDVIKLLTEAGFNYDASRNTFSGVSLKYRLLEDAGPDSKEDRAEYSDSFSRTEPGVYRVRVWATGTLAGSPFNEFKDVTLTILPKTVTVVKYWDDDGQEEKRPEELTVTLKANNGGEEVSLPSFIESGWTQSGSTWTKTFTNLPFGDGDDIYTYSVKEIVPAGYHQVGEAIEDSEQAHTSRLKDDKYQNDTFTITNAPNTLTVVKRVTGDMGERNRAFTFTLAVDGGGSFVWYKNGEKESAELSSGGTFTLKDGERVAIEFLPAATNITISEQNENYATSWSLDGTVKQSDSDNVTIQLAGNGELAVTNNLEPVAPTGVNTRAAPFLLMMLLALGVLALNRGKRERGGDPPGE